MTVGFFREIAAGERRVAMVPAQVPALTKAGCALIMERGAGDPAGYPDSAYEERGVRVLQTEDAVLSEADVLLCVRAAAAAGSAESAARGSIRESRMRAGQAVIGFLEPYAPDSSFRVMKDGRITSFSMELMPRITRAQSMDALSSMANLSGYKAVLVGADALPRMLPMMMTAAGTVVPARIFIVGAGVAGLQAIATARRLGGVVSAYDVRSEVKEQVASLGARFIEMELDTSDAGGAGGYAREMGEEFYTRQQELMGGILAESDVVITTASVPGRKAPVLITAEMVERMTPGSVIVDLAAERGGNCELTRSGQTVEHHGVKILGPANLVSTLAHTASQLYARNIATFLLSMTKDGQFLPDLTDEIVSATLVTHDGQVPNESMRRTLGL